MDEFGSRLQWLLIGQFFMILSFVGNFVASPAILQAFLGVSFAVANCTIWQGLLFIFPK